MVICFLIASYQDFKQRLVDGYIWLVLLILVIPTFLVRLIIYWSYPDIIVYMLISMGLGLILAFFMLLFGLWGGADIIALFCLSLLSPIALPLTNGIPSVFSKNFLEFMVPISLALIMNAALLQIPIPILVAFKNYFRYKKHPEAYILPKAPGIHKIFASFLGEPLSLSTILAKPVFHYQVLEKNSLFMNNVELNTKYPVPFIRLTSEPLLRWKMFKPQPLDRFSIERPIDKLLNFHQPYIRSKPFWSFDFSIGLKSEEEDLYRQRTLLEHATKGDLQRNFLWVQYSIPFLIPMLLGYVLAFLGINLLLEVFNFLHLI